MIGSAKVLGALIRIGLSGNAAGPMTPESFRRFVKQYAPGVFESLMRSAPHMEVAGLIPAAIRMFELDREEAAWLQEVLEHFQASARVSARESS